MGYQKVLVIAIALSSFKPFDVNSIFTFLQVIDKNTFASIQIILPNYPALLIVLILYIGMTVLVNNLRNISISIIMIGGNAFIHMAHGF